MRVGGDGHNLLDRQYQRVQECMGRHRWLHWRRLQVHTSQRTVTNKSRQKDVQLSKTVGTYSDGNLLVVYEMSKQVLWIVWVVVYRREAHAEWLILTFQRHRLRLRHTWLSAWLARRVVDVSSGSSWREKERAEEEKDGCMIQKRIWVDIVAVVRNGACYLFIFVKLMFTWLGNSLGPLQPCSNQL